MFEYFAYLFSVFCISYNETVYCVRIARLSLHINFLNSNVFKVNKLTLKPYRFYRRKRKTPAEILQLAVQKERERKEKEREKAKAKKPKVTFWQVTMNCDK